MGDQSISGWLRISALINIIDWVCILYDGYNNSAMNVWAREFSAPCVVQCLTAACIIFILTRSSQCTRFGRQFPQWRQSKLHQQITMLLNISTYLSRHLCIWGTHIAFVEHRWMAVMVEHRDYSLSCKRFSFLICIVYLFTFLLDFSLVSCHGTTL